MSIIAIDTAGLRTNSFSISLKTERGVFTRRYDFISRVFVEKLLPAIKSLCDEAQVSPTEISSVLVLEGPGSFTGLRLAYSAAKAFTLANNAKLIPIPTLSCIAHMFTKYKGQILVAVDAKRSSVYAQVFQNQKALTEVFDKPFAEVLTLLQNKKTLCACIGYESIFANLNFSELDNNLSEKIKNKIEFIEVKNTLSLAMIDFFNTHKDALLAKKEDDYLAPIYVRKSDAER
ncbi:MAG: tRNA (adenosine(37)-N6)-threonylcarbamoyltransferase complex dimerization subunit type 1 TsaB [Treponemataceae bacterium]